MKLKKSVNISLFIIITILIVASGGLLKKTMEYKHENRKLILQNDSLQSVVISLSRNTTDTTAARWGNRKTSKKKARNS